MTKTVCVMIVLQEIDGSWILKTFQWLGKVMKSASCKILWNLILLLTASKLPQDGIEKRLRYAAGKEWLLGSGMATEDALEDQGTYKRLLVLDGWLQKFHV